MTTPASPLALDRKVTHSSHSGSSSHGMSSNVVDHLAPGVTEHVPPPSHVRRPVHYDGKIISVQPLKKEEMQVW